MWLPITVCHVRVYVHTRDMNVCVAWPQQMTKDNPVAHTQFVAALAGHFSWSKIQLDGRRVPTKDSNPFLKVLFEDIQQLRNTTTEKGLLDSIDKEGFAAIMERPFQKLDANKLLSYDWKLETESKSVSRICGYQHDDGSLCDFWSDNATSVSSHLYNEHGVSQAIYNAMMSNQCPWCDVVLGGRTHLKSHLCAARKRYICPTLQRQSISIAIAVPCLSGKITLSAKFLGASGISSSSRTTIATSSFSTH